MALAQQFGCVGAVDVLRRKPQLALELAAVGEPRDVRVPERRRQVGLLVEPRAVVQIDRGLGRNQMKNLLARKPWVLGHVELTELLVSKLPHDAKSSGRRSNDQRHGEMVQTGDRNPGHAGERVRMSA